MLCRNSILVLLLVGIWGVSTAQSAEPLRIAVASNFLLPIKVLVNDYETKSGERLTISSGSTGKLYAQIINGAPFDIYFAANSREPLKLEEKGIGVPGSRFTYAIGRLSLWSMHTQDPLGALQSGQVKRLAIANPATAPYGAAAVSVLKALEVDRSSRPKLITAENVSQTYQFIATGNVELGFVSYSQLVARGQENSAWMVPDSYHDPILQQAILIKRARTNKSAHEFLAYLKSSHAKSLIRSFGYNLDANR